eukprot:TRINITY_DN28565_c0_g1_i1.p1 TRINITY_DN28565_c0_g1~~TRINITY_DN28565_c0_g1_i1.p1  ORF type:complete len:112 (+),score=17.16 TRINITY_DN28565_c0_g1_i1:163-498(+)
MDRKYHMMIKNITKRSHTINTERYGLTGPPEPKMAIPSKTKPMILVAMTKNLAGSCGYETNYNFRQNRLLHIVRPRVISQSPLHSKLFLAAHRTLSLILAARLRLPRHDRG